MAFRNTCTAYMYCKYIMYVSGLTGSGQWCVPLHTLSASCEPEPVGWGRLSWSLARRGMGTSAGTGSDAPPAGLPGAIESKSCGDEKKKKVRNYLFFSPNINHHTCIKIHCICSTHIAPSIKHLADLSISQIGFCQKYRTSSRLAVETRLTRAVTVNQNSEVVYIDYVD